MSRSVSSSSFRGEEQLRRIQLLDRVFVLGFRIITYGILGLLSLLFLWVLAKGFSAFWSSEEGFQADFLFGFPENRYVFIDSNGQQIVSESELHEYAPLENDSLADLNPEIYTYAGGGIFPAIVGSFFLISLTMFFTAILGISAAVYLSEYAEDSRAIRLVRLAILNLSGVPSIIYGLFGLGIFVLFLGWGESLLAGSCTLALLSLPLMITSCEEALRAVPQHLREASLGLGASRWQTLWRTVLPHSLPGMITASILAMVRVAGETAPIFFTAAFAFRDLLPWQVANLGEFFFQGVMALPFHLYILLTRLPVNEHTEPTQYGTALVFVALVGGLTLCAHFLRSRYREEAPAMIK